ncbi:hypothetical protein JW933_06580, partial [candidate division FCPU426 bacterium]|nr:hypothetical protein [candidate division FCPU426 bacterium]
VSMDQWIFMTFGKLGSYKFNDVLYPALARIVERKKAELRRQLEPEIKSQLKAGQELEKELARAVEEALPSALPQIHYTGDDHPSPVFKGDKFSGEAAAKCIMGLMYSNIIYTGRVPEEDLATYQGVIKGKPSVQNMAHTSGTGRPGQLGNFGSTPAMALLSVPDNYRVHLGEGLRFFFMGGYESTMREDIRRMRDNGMELFAQQMNGTFFAGKSAEITHEQVFRLFKQRFYLGKGDNVDLIQIRREIFKLSESQQGRLKLKQAAIKINQELGGKVTLLGTHVFSDDPEDVQAQKYTTDLLALIDCITSPAAREAMQEQFLMDLYSEREQDKAPPKETGPPAAEETAPAAPGPEAQQKIKAVDVVLGVVGLLGLAGGITLAVLGAVPLAVSLGVAGVGLVLGLAILGKWLSVQPAAAEAVLGIAALLTLAGGITLAALGMVPVAASLGLAGVGLAVALGVWGKWLKARHTMADTALGWAGLAGLAGAYILAAVGIAPLAATLGLAGIGLAFVLGVLARLAARQPQPQLPAAGQARAAKAESAKAKSGKYVPETILEVARDFESYFAFFETPAGKRALTEASLLNRALQTRQALPSTVARDMMKFVAGMLDKNLPRNQRWMQWIWKSDPLGRIVADLALDPHGFGRMTLHEIGHVVKQMALVLPVTLPVKIYQEFIKDFVWALIPILRAVKDFIIDVLKRFIPWLMKVVQDFVASILRVTWVQKVIRWIKQAVAKIVEFVKKVKNWIVNAWRWIKDTVKSVWEHYFVPLGDWLRANIWLPIKQKVLVPVKEALIDYTKFTADYLIRFKIPVTGMLFANAIIFALITAMQDTLGQLITSTVKIGAAAAFNPYQTVSSVAIILILAPLGTFVMEILIERIFRYKTLKTGAQMGYGMVPTLAYMGGLSLNKTGAVIVTALSPLIGLVRTLETMILGIFISAPFNQGVVQKMPERLKIPVMLVKDWFVAIIRSVIYLLPLPITVLLWRWLITWLPQPVIDVIVLFFTTIQTAVVWVVDKVVVVLNLEPMHAFYALATILLVYVLFKHFNILGVNKRQAAQNRWRLAMVGSVVGLGILALWHWQLIMPTLSLLLSIWVLKTAAAAVKAAYGSFRNYIAQYQDKTPAGRIWKLIYDFGSWIFKFSYLFFFGFLLTAVAWSAQNFPMTNLTAGIVFVILTMAGLTAAGETGVLGKSKARALTTIIMTATFIVSIWVFLTSASAVPLFFALSTGLLILMIAGMFWVFRDKKAVKKITAQRPDSWRASEERARNAEVPDDPAWRSRAFNRVFWYGLAGALSVLTWLGQSPRLPGYVYNETLSHVTPEIQVGSTLRIPSLQQAMDLLIYYTSTVPRQQHNVDYAASGSLTNETGQPQAALTQAVQDRPIGRLGALVQDLYARLSGFLRDMFTPIKLEAGEIPAYLSSHLVSQTTNQAQAYPENAVLVKDYPTTVYALTAAAGETFGTVIVLDQSFNARPVDSTTPGFYSNLGVPSNNVALECEGSMETSGISWEVSSGQLMNTRFLRYEYTEAYKGRQGTLDIVLLLRLQDGREVEVTVRPWKTDGYSETDLIMEIEKAGYRLEDVDRIKVTIATTPDMARAYGTLQNVRLESEHTGVYQAIANLDLRDIQAVRAVCEDWNISFTFLLGTLQDLYYGYDPSNPQVTELARYNWYLRRQSEIARFQNPIQINAWDAQHVLDDPRWTLDALEYKVRVRWAGFAADGWDGRYYWNFIVPDEMVFNPETFETEYQYFLVSQQGDFEFETGLSGNQMRGPVVAGFNQTARVVDFRNVPAEERSLPPNSIELTAFLDILGLSPAGFDNLLTQTWAFPDEMNALVEQLNALQADGRLSDGDIILLKQLTAGTITPEDKIKLLEDHDLWEQYQQDILSRYSARELEYLRTMYLWQIFNFYPGDRLQHELQATLAVGSGSSVVGRCVERADQKVDMRAILLELNHLMVQDGYQPLTYAEFERIIREDTGMNGDTLLPWTKYFFSKYWTPEVLYSFMHTRHPAYLQAKRDERLLPFHEMDFVNEHIGDYWDVFQEQNWPEILAGLDVRGVLSQYNLKAEDILALTQMDQREFYEAERPAKDAALIIFLHYQGVLRDYGFASPEELFELTFNLDAMWTRGVIYEENYEFVLQRLVAGGYLKKYGINTMQDMENMLTAMCQDRQNWYGPESFFIRREPVAGGQSPLADYMAGYERYEKGEYEGISTEGKNAFIRGLEWIADQFNFLRGFITPAPIRHSELFVAYESNQVTLNRFFFMVDEHTRLTRQAMEFRKAEIPNYPDLTTVPAFVLNEYRADNVSRTEDLSIRFWEKNPAMSDQMILEAYSPYKLFNRELADQWCSLPGWDEMSVARYMYTLFYRNRMGEDKSLNNSIARNLIAAYEEGRLPVLTAEEARDMWQANYQAALQRFGKDAKTPEEKARAEQSARAEADRLAADYYVLNPAHEILPFDPKAVSNPESGRLSVPLAGDYSDPSMLYQPGQDVSVWQWETFGGATFKADAEGLTIRGDTRLNQAYISRKMVIPEGYYIIAIQVDSISPNSQLFFKIDPDSNQQIINDEYKQWHAYYQNAYDRYILYHTAEKAEAMARQAADQLIKPLHEQNGRLQASTPLVRTTQSLATWDIPSPSTYYIILSEAELKAVQGTVRMDIGITGQWEESPDILELDPESPYFNAPTGHSSAVEGRGAHIRGIEILTPAQCPAEIQALLQDGANVMNWSTSLGIVYPDKGIDIGPWRDTFPRYNNQQGLNMGVNAQEVSNADGTWLQMSGTGGLQTFFNYQMPQTQIINLGGQGAYQVRGAPSQGYGQITDAQGNVVKLWGLNIDTARAEWWDNATPASMEQLLQFVDSQGANSIKIQVPYGVFGAADVNKTYLEKLETLVELARARNIVVNITLFGDYRDFQTDLENDMHDPKQHLLAIVDRLRDHPNIIYSLTDQPDEMLRNTTQLNWQRDELREAMVGWLGVMIPYFKQMDGEQHLLMLQLDNADVFHDVLLRPAMLDKVDGISFQVDSAQEAVGAQIESLKNLLLQYNLNCFLMVGSFPSGEEYVQRIGRTIFEDQDISGGYISAGTLTAGRQSAAFAGIGQAWTRTRGQNRTMQVYADDRQNPAEELATDNDYSAANQWQAQNANVSWDEKKDGLLVKGLGGAGTNEAGARLQEEINVDLDNDNVWLNVDITENTRLYYITIYHPSLPNGYVYLVYDGQGSRVNINIADVLREYGLTGKQSFTLAFGVKDQFSEHQNEQAQARFDFKITRVQAHLTAKTKAGQLERQTMVVPINPDEWFTDQQAGDGVLDTSMQISEYGFISRRLRLQNLPRYLVVKVDSRTPNASSNLILKVSKNMAGRAGSEVNWIRITPSYAEGGIMIYNLDTPEVRELLLKDVESGQYYEFVIESIVSSDLETISNITETFTQQIYAVYDWENAGQPVTADFLQNGTTPNLILGAQNQDPTRRIVKI